MAFLWAVSIGLLCLSVGLLGVWFRDRRRMLRSEGQVPLGWLEPVSGEGQGSQAFAVSGTPVAPSGAQRRSRRRQLHYTPPASAEITSEFRTPF